MPGLYDMQDETMMVDELDDTMFSDFDNLEDFVIEEEDEMYAEDPVIVEENYADDEMYVFDKIGDDNLVVDEDEAMDEQSTGFNKIPGSEIDYIDDSEIEKDVSPKDWENDGDHEQFVQYARDKITKIPKHSGETVPGCERAKAYLKSLDNEISKAMRTDLDGKIDELEIDKIRKSIEDMIDRLEKQIKKLRGTKKAAFDVKLVSESYCEKCGSTAPQWHDVDNDQMVCMSCDASKMKGDDSLEKTASTPVLNVYVNAFERAVVGTIINSKVSSGRNIEATYEKLKNKYNFSPREELAIQQLVADYGYPVFKDRGLLNEPSDPSSGDGVDWITNYHA